MADMTDTPARDKWARWLLKDRFGSSDEQRRDAVTYVEKVRDRVLDAAAIAAGEVFLDVGCGDGLLGFGAMQRSAGSVVFTDISCDLLEECRRIATKGGVIERCSFVHTGLPDLGGIPDESVDIAGTRSVIIYVRDKPAVFRTLHRVLKPGGRLSIFEPISSFAAERSGRLWGFDMRGLEPLAAKIRQTRDRYTEPGTLLGFDERDLIAYAEAAGFDDITLTYEANSGFGEPQPEPDLQEYLGIVPNPTMPSLGAVIEEALSPAERDRVVAHFREQFIAGRHQQRGAVTYLSARRR